jgi:RNA-directed DNA polymerase
MASSGECIRRIIDKWLNAGVLEDGLLHFATEGTPQGGVISPILSNIFLHSVVDRWFFLHHVLDAWFEKEVRPRLIGTATLVRFADDFVMTFETHHDAKRVLEVLDKRLGRFGLTLHPDKTRFLDFRPQRHGGTHADCKDAAFDFLGFTHAWVKSRNGKNVVRQTTAKTKLCPRADRAQGLVPSQSASADPRSARPAVCQARRSLRHLRHHGNSRRLQQYRHQVTKIWCKWLARRTRSKRLPWDRFNAFLARHPLPPARLVHRYAN